MITVIVSITISYLFVYFLLDFAVRLLDCIEKVPGGTDSQLYKIIRGDKFMANCSWCNAEMAEERLEIFDTCIKCTDQNKYVGFQVSPHKTGSYPVLIKPSNKEQIRQATNANNRKR